MTDSLNRRRFLGVSASTGLALGVAGRTARAAASANETLVAGVMGMGGRGTTLATEFQKQTGVEVSYVCDVDSRRADQAARSVAQATDGSPKPIGDFRTILDDRSVDILVIATCNHWHAPAAILGCSAGKHVYVEKPCCHNPREGELTVEAARKYDRRVQHGTQRRSWPKIIEAIRQVQKGAIGRPYYAQAWYNNNRPSIGHGEQASPPSHIDYDLWQGPAPRKPFRSNYLHYNWHWFWHWGNGEVGNNGIHMLDLCRWGLGVDYPVKVSSLGGRYRFNDDQQTPDTNMVVFDYPDEKSIRWEGLSCNRMPGGRPFDVVFHGEEGSLAIRGGSYALFDVKGRQKNKVGGSGGNAVHVGSFLDAIRNGTDPSAEIEDGHKSTLPCHLANISYRTGRTLHCDPENGHILDDEEAMAHWSREYEPGWEPQV